jgi:hypothetical protein
MIEVESVIEANKRLYNKKWQHENNNAAQK